MVPKPKEGIAVVKPPPNNGIAVVAKMIIKTKFMYSFGDSDVDDLELMTIYEVGD